MSEPATKPSPPNWANKTSALIAAALFIATVVAWGVRLEMRVTNTERTIEALVRTSPVPDVADGKAAVPQKRDVCADLAQRVASAIENGSPLSVGDPIQDLMKRMGCITEDRSR